MMYKNSFKLIFSNFSLVWKLLLFLFVATGISSLFSILSAMPIYEVLQNEGVVDALTSSYRNFVTNINIYELVQKLSNLFEQFLNVLKNNMGDLLIYVILFVFFVFIFSNFLRGFYLVTTCNTLNYYMSSNSKKPFIGSFFESFKQNLFYQLIYLITILPIKLLIYYLVILSFKLFFFSGIVGILAPFISILIYVILNSFRVAFFSGWVPSLVIKNQNVFVALINSFKVSYRRFSKTFSNSIMVVLTIMFMNFFVGLFTFGVALIVTIPCSYLFISIFNMVVFYSSNGLRFYVEPTIVIAPKKMEFTEKIKKFKFVI